MSMLTSQVERLRAMSEFMLIKGNLYFGEQLRDAADSIEELRSMLAEGQTCHNASKTDGIFACSKSKCRLRA